jgi:hypothetical protein
MADISQILPLVGVVLGAFGSHLLTQRLENAKFLRERRARWEDRQLDAYTSYAMALKLSVMAALRVAAFHGNHPHASPIPPDEGAALLGETLSRREQAWENLLLTGNPRVIAAATEWHKSVWSLEQFAKSQAKDPTRFDELWNRFDALRTAYYREVREGLHLDHRTT